MSYLRQQFIHYVIVLAQIRRLVVEYRAVSFIPPFIVIDVLA